MKLSGRKRIFATALVVMLAVSVIGVAYAAEALSTQLATGATVTMEDAKSIALSEAGFSKADVMMTGMKEGTEHRMTVYEIEFIANGVEYEYEIDATDGGIVGTKTEKLRDRELARLSGQFISMDDAVAAALANAGATVDQAALLEVQFDFEDGYAVYEVELLIDRQVHKTEIDAESGEVIRYRTKTGRDRDQASLQLSAPVKK